jgi:hypothetical protein
MGAWRATQTFRLGNYAADFRHQGAFMIGTFGVAPALERGLPQIGCYGTANGRCTTEDRSVLTSVDPRTKDEVSTPLL